MALNIKRLEPLPHIEETNPPKKPLSTQTPSEDDLLRKDPEPNSKKTESEIVEIWKKLWIISSRN